MLNMRNVLLAICLLFSNNALSGEHLVVNTGFTPPVSTVFNKLLTEAAKRLGMTLELHEISGERALALADEGVADAECCRIPEIVLRQYHNLIPVSEGVFVVNFSAFARNPEIRISRWEDLKPYSVGTVTGWKILVQNMQRIEPKQSFVLDKPESLFRMLDNGRVEVALLGELSGIDAINKLNIKNISTLTPPLASNTLYLMFNKRHEKLAPKFAATLKAMQADGTAKRITDEVVNGKSR